MFLRLSMSHDHRNEVRIYELMEGREGGWKKRNKVGVNEGRWVGGWKVSPEDELWE